MTSSVSACGLFRRSGKFAKGHLGVRSPLMASMGSKTRLGCVKADLEVAFAHAVFARLLRSKLDVELHRISNPFALGQRIGQHAGIHVHIFVLARRAGSYNALS